jgi:hypothetical protein
MAQAIRIKVEGYLTYIPTHDGDEDIEQIMAIDLDEADNDPMFFFEDAKLTFTGEIVDVEVNENNEIIEEGK